MTDAEILRQLDAIRYGITMSELARIAGISRESILQAQRRRRLSSRTAEALRRALQTARIEDSHNPRSAA